MAGMRNYPKANMTVEYFDTVRQTLRPGKIDSVVADVAVIRAAGGASYAGMVTKPGHTYWYVP